MGDPLDREAVALLRRRDPRGFDRAYASHAAKIRGFLLRLGRNAALADDLLQHTFLRLAEQGPELRPDSDLRAWLFAVARNAYASHARRATPERDDAALEALASPPPDVEARLLLGDVESALGRLRADDREVLLLVGAEGLEQSVVATMLGIQPAALRQRLARARSRLLAELEHAPSSLDVSKKGVLP
ncbi:MAG TPA: RNA polymerase sigma factor [Polyangiaceae bacterium]